MGGGTLLKKRILIIGGTAGVGFALARDRDIGKVLVVAPSGINTKFWEGTSEDTSTMLDVGWVAEQIVTLTLKRSQQRVIRCE